MGTFDELEVGDRIAGPTRSIGPQAIDIATGFGGYIHPLFNDLAWVRARTPFDRIPLPGELVLFLLGGMAEQTGIFDETTLALVGMDEVRFTTPAFPGDVLTLNMEVIGKRRSASGARGSVRFLWRCSNQAGEEVLTAQAELLFKLDPRAGQAHEGGRPSR